MEQTPRCARCGDVIGVYEPVVVEAEGTARLTSGAAEPDLLISPPGVCYHRDCYEAADR